MKRIATTAICALLALAPSAAKEKETIKVIPVSQDADAANNGIIYSLPQTALRIKVVAELTIEKAGPYFKYSNKYLNLTNVITDDSRTWRIVSADIEGYGIADNTKRYKIIGTSSDVPAVTLMPDGRLVGINTASAPAEEHPSQPTDNIPELTFDNIRLDRSVLTKTSTAAMAEEIAQTIYKLRDKRMQLLGGEEATILNDAGSYDKVNAALDQLEDDYISLFAGKRATVQVVRYFYITPDTNGVPSSVLFRFSNKTGFLDPMDLSGKPVYIDLSFSKPAQLNQYAETSKQRKNAPLNGLRYIAPGNVNVKIIDRNVLIKEANVSCAQCGQIVSLPEATLNTAGKEIRLNTTTGALEYIGNK